MPPPGRRRTRPAGRFRRSRGYPLLVSLGLAGYGLVHLVTAALTLTVAFGADANTSQAGALEEVARRPLGFFLLVATGVGLLTCAFWQLIDATVGRAGAAPYRWTKRVASAGRATTYLVVGLLALATSVRPDGGGLQGETITERVLDQVWGPWVIVAIGGTVVGVGVSQVWRGVRRRFREDLTREAGRPTVVFGVVGYTAKGLVLMLIGGLFLAAALTHDPGRVGGMDVALDDLRERPFGPVLLAAMAGGIACFGLYCLVWSRRARV